MPLPDLDTSVGHSFGLEVDGVTIARFPEIAGLRMERDVVEVQEATEDGEQVRRRLPGRFKAGEVTLTRGLTSDTSLARWIQDARADGGRQPAASLVVHDAEGAPVRRFRLAGARPRCVEVTTTKAGDTAVLTEKLTISYDALDSE